MTRFEDRLARTVSAVLGLSLLAAPGCGGKGDGGPTVATPPTTDGAATPTSATDLPTTETSGPTTDPVTAPDDTGTPATGSAPTTNSSVPCIGDSADTSALTDTASLAAQIAGMCSGGAAPYNYLLADAYVAVAPGGVCPDPACAVPALEGCSDLDWELTCALSSVTLDQRLVSDGYGGFWQDASLPVGAGEYDLSGRMDVCWYTSVWYDDPYYSTTCGRPLLREGAPVVAPVVPGATGWAAAPHPVVAGLTEPERAAAEAYWSEAASLEHASVASFAHASLDLMRFGAPPELLTATHQAALDEIEHARLCFALASGYAGRTVGPGPLAAPAAPSPSLMEVAEAVFREGCVGETMAAVDAAARLAGARDGAVRAALEVIVRDESAHAALAWRTLRWILDRDRDGAARERLAAAYAEEEARWTAPAGGAVSAGARAHGLLGTAERSRELRRAWRDVVAPSWAELV